MSLNKFLYAFIFSFSVFYVSAQDILMQDGTFNQCSGTFFDSGGSSANYSDSENSTLTLCPDMPDMRVVLEFVLFQVNNDGDDQMTIYDADTADPGAILGTFTGDLAANPELASITASDANLTGCLTIEFTSNTFFEGEGWEAIISCRPPCQVIEAVIDDISPSTFNNDIYTVNLSQTLDFSASAIFGDGFDAGATYEWDFGDGNTATGQNVQHTYTNIGTFFVNLTVTDANGCTSFNTLNQQVDVIFDASEPGPGCPNVTGEDLLFDCDIPDTATLNSSFLVTGETTTYRVDPIQYAPPFPFTGLSNPISVNTDDVWSPVIDLPFDFCYFGTVRDQIIVGSNGLISFDISNANGFNNWSIDPGDTLPNNSNTSLSEGNIMLAHDINPNVSSSNPEIAWEIIGQAPCRTFVVSFSNVAHFSCNDISTSFMMILYETTNAIEFYIDNKPVCNSWNDGLASLGIQNDTGTVAFTPPNRNTGVWNATQEAWRFTPDGTPNVTFEWFDPAGNFFSSSPTITVPVNGDETYTAVATYTNCNGNQVVVSDDAVIDVNPQFEVTLDTPNPFICSGSNTTIDAEITIPNDSNITQNDIEYAWFLDGTPLSDDTASIVADQGGVYTVEATGGPCTLSEDITISVAEIPEITIPPEDLTVCGDFTLTQTFDLTQNDEAALGI
ncbi:PKD domain-containing protein, partial [Flavobacteriaceae bacterium 14752]|uniref:PKD domain-containing protein n=1 Tax=Mesohalobacter salilacus TaxID=2491711 RepID=UPI000F63F924